MDYNLIRVPQIIRLLMQTYGKYYTIDLLDVASYLHGLAFFNVTEINKDNIY